MTCVFDSIDVDFNSEDVQKLENYLEENIESYKNLSKYDNFIVEYPTVQIQIDQENNYEIIAAYYEKIYSKIFNLIDSTEDLRECIINYVTSTQVMEIVDAKIKSTSNVKGYELINCKAEGIFEDCFFVGSEIRNAQVTKSKLQHSDATNSKILNCNVEASTLENCYFMDGYLNGDMQGGVYRSGKLGPFATMDSEVKIVTDHDNFFDTKYDEESKGDKKGVIDTYQKSYGKK